MKRLFVFISILAAVALSLMPLRTTTTAAGTRHKQSATVEFKEQTKVLNLLLSGKYLIVHDDERMAGGEDCTYIYETTSGEPGKLVISFHCIPLTRTKASSFIYRTALISANSNIQELREFQFAGSTESHGVPSAKTEPGVVSLAP
jgi:hypothetical protein